MKPFQRKQETESNGAKDDAASGMDYNIFLKEFNNFELYNRNVSGNDNTEEHKEEHKEGHKKEQKTEHKEANDYAAMHHGDDYNIFLDKKNNFERFGAKPPSKSRKASASSNDKKKKHTKRANDYAAMHF